MTPENISALLLKSKTYNQANAITGCLLYYGDEFIQLIEGDQKTVQDLYPAERKLSGIWRSSCCKNSPPRGYYRAQD